MSASKVAANKERRDKAKTIGGLQDVAGNNVQLRTLQNQPENNNNSRRRTYHHEQGPGRLPRTSFIKNEGYIETTIEDQYNNPDEKPGPKKSAAVRMRSGSPKERLTRHAKSHYIVKWGEAGQADFSARITDIKELEAQKKIDELMEIECLIIEDEDRLMTAVPSKMAKLKQLRSFSLKYAKIKSLPSWLSTWHEVRKISVTETFLMKIDVLCKLKQLTTVDISRNCIQTIPKQLSHLESLREFHASGNSISSLPMEMKGLKNLETLVVSANKIQIFPREICQLEKLKKLDLSRNVIEKVPEEIGYLQSLVYLCLSSNRLHTLPAALWNLSNLKHLTADKNNFEMIPADISQLESLEHLNMKNNKITRVADMPTNVKVILLDGNHIRDIDVIAKKATKLEVLSLRKNELMSVPLEIKENRQLKALYVDDNPVEHLPSELGEIGKLRHLTLTKTRIRELPGNFSNVTSHLSLFDVQHTKLSDDVIMSSTKGIAPELVMATRSKAKSKPGPSAGKED